MYAVLSCVLTRVRVALHLFCINFRLLPSFATRTTDADGRDNLPFVSFLFSRLAFSVVVVVDDLSVMGSLCFFFLSFCFCLVESKQRNRRCSPPSCAMLLKQRLLWCQQGGVFGAGLLCLSLAR